MDLFQTTFLKNVVAYPYRRILQLLPDKQYYQVMYFRIFRKKINFNKPKTYTEKLQWLKLYDRNPEYTKLVDKYDVRSFVEDKIGSKYLIPILGVYNTFDEINFSELPNEFVIKCTHDSGSVVICKDRAQLNIEAAKKIIEKGLKNNYYSVTKEWPYKNVKPRIIIEKYMVDESGTELKDYKFFCFDGIPKALFVATDRAKDTRFTFFDTNFNEMGITRNHYLPSNDKISKPENYEEMLALSKVLSRNIPHIRVDFYNINGKIYFGELTFYHFSGFVKFHPNEYDNIFGNWLRIPRKTKLN